MFSRTFRNHGKTRLYTIVLPGFLLFSRRIKPAYNIMI
ncbi:hypothetical protein LEP1GSC060_0707 [Leptospira weilii serovar Ranarum str. ICFT]|uniref:Uncharacterized protein n=1 Tax=Leptospira weilii serovar Ranarum str. ICFT TaxID=1218598 RepID=N1WM62_9LEPT|nr:hypothetical protein LEP1GSC060_0707 [Leptospira weilii serovar Ranarum str. ICFT]